MLRFFAGIFQEARGESGSRRGRDRLCGFDFQPLVEDTAEHIGFEDGHAMVGFACTRTWHLRVRYGLHVTLQWECSRLKYDGVR